MVVIFVGQEMVWCPYVAQRLHLGFGAVARILGSDLSQSVQAVVQVVGLAVLRARCCLKSIKVSPGLNIVTIYVKHASTGMSIARALRPHAVSWSAVQRQ